MPCEPVTDFHSTGAYGSGLGGVSLATAIGIQSAQCGALHGKATCASVSGCEWVPDRPRDLPHTTATAASSTDAPAPASAPAPNWGLLWIGLGVLLAIAVVVWVWMRSSHFANTALADEDGPDG